MPAKNQYVIVRDDLFLDPITIVSEGLLIGRLPQCEVRLNHPSVSRLPAGIKQLEGDYYLFALRPNNPVVLNGLRRATFSRVVHSSSRSTRPATRWSYESNSRLEQNHLSSILAMRVSALTVSSLPTMRSQRSHDPRRLPEPKRSMFFGTREFAKQAS